MVSIAQNTEVAIILRIHKNAAAIVAITRAVSFNKRSHTILRSDRELLALRLARQFAASKLTVKRPKYSNDEIGIRGIANAGSCSCGASWI